MVNFDKNMWAAPLFRHTHHDTQYCIEKNLVSKYFTCSRTRLLRNTFRKRLFGSNLKGSIGRLGANRRRKSL